MLSRIIGTAPYFLGESILQQPAAKLTTIDQTGSSSIPQPAVAELGTIDQTMIFQLRSLKLRNCNLMNINALTSNNRWCHKSLE